MIAIISPAKTLDDTPVEAHLHTLPRFMTETKSLVQILKKKKPADLMELMSISEKLAIQNHQRYKGFQFDMNTQNSKAAIFTFKGEVYLGLKALEMDADDLDFAQTNLRILSGLYGMLRPLDLMQEYRLEMGTTLENKKGSNLYAFWGDRVTKLLNQDIAATKSKYLVNLASHEYMKVLDKKKLKAKVLDINFLEEKNGKRIFVSFNAKKARGLMASYIIKNKLTEPDQLKKFDIENYTFDAESSDATQFTFIR